MNKEIKRTLIPTSSNLKQPATGIALQDWNTWQLKEPRAHRV